MDTDKQRINLQLDVHTLSTVVSRQSEQNYREAAAMLNRRFKYYRSAFPSASAEMLWVYVALESAVSLHSDARSKSLQPIEARLKQLNEQLQRTLDESATHD